MEFGFQVDGTMDNKIMMHIWYAMHGLSNDTNIKGLSFCKIITTRMTAQDLFKIRDSSECT